MSIEIGGGAAIKEQAVNRAQKKPEIAKQRAQRRAKGNEGTQSVERGHGPSLRQEVSGVQVVDRGPAKRWQRAYALPSFEDPEGYSYCWISRHKRRHGDDANLLAMIREGWEFVKPSELPTEDVPTESFTGRLSKHGEVVGDETTILMKLPDELKRQRDAFYNRKRDEATKAVTKRRPGLAEATNAMPLVEDRNDVSHDFVRMRGRRAAGKTDDE